MMLLLNNAKQVFLLKYSLNIIPPKPILFFRVISFINKYEVFNFVRFSSVKIVLYFNKIYVSNMGNFWPSLNKIRIQLQF
jgi:hypothetical protein